MNVVIKHDSVDISNYVISYDREHEICTGIASLDIAIAEAVGRTFHPWDVIEVWENGNKKAKFYISDLENDEASGIIKLICQDESKKLTDYFVTDSYLIDYLSYSRPWIEQFLDEAGISYTFTVDGSNNGVPLSNNTSLGFDNAYSIVTTLLQQSGWYIYFDQNGTAIIGDLYKNVNYPDHTIDANDFSEFKRELDDDRLRNRAVVWGNTNPTYGEVFVDISVQTPWNYDAQDKRAVVIANSSIYSHDQALTLAQKLLKEFTQIKDEKYLLVLNDYNMKLGEILKVNSTYWSGRGLITRIQAAMSENGLVYGVTLDIKCPRMFTFYSNLPTTVSGFYVYTGHVSDGIWRKYTQGSSWYNDSSGLEAGAEVKDLAIRNGTFATVLDDGYLYTRSSEVSPWYKYNHGSLRDINGNSYPETDIRAAACSVNYSDNIIAGFNYVPSGIPVSGYTTASGVSWVLELTGSQSLIKAEQVVISGGVTDGYTYAIVDLESTGEYNIISVSGLAPASGIIPNAAIEYNGFGAGYRTTNLKNINNANSLPPDSKSLSLGWGYNFWDSGDIDIIHGSGASAWSSSSLICDNDSTTFWYADDDGYVVKLDAEARSSTAYAFTPPAIWSFPNSVSLGIRHSGGNNFDIVASVSIDATDAIHAYLYHYTLGDSTLTSSADQEIVANDYYGKGWGLIGNQAMWGRVDGGTKVTVLNLISGSFSNITLDTDPGVTYQNAGTSSFLFATGQNIIFAHIGAYATDPETYPTCPLFPITAGTSVSVYSTYYTITEYGGSYQADVSLIKKWEPEFYPDIGPERHIEDLSISFSGGYPAVNTLLGIGYQLVRLTIDTWGCHPQGGDILMSGHTLGISYPGQSLWYYKWSDEGGGYQNTGWWDRSAEYIPLNATELVGKKYRAVAELSTTGFGSLWGSCGKYSTPGWFVFEDMTVWSDWEEMGYISWKEFRNAPSYQGFGWDTFYGLNDPLGGGYSYDEDNLGLYSVNAPHDDLFGLIVASSVSDYNGDAIVSFFRWDNEYQYQVRVPVGNTGFGGLTQKYYVYRTFNLILPSVPTAIDNLPYGTILKHTSTPELGNKITASDIALEQTMGVFEIIKTTQVPVKVDIAQGVPTIIYDIPEQDGEDSIEFWGSITNSVDSFYTHATSKPVYEAKVFSLPSPGSFPTVSGTFNPKDYERYIGISNREGILASEYDLSTPWVNMVTVASGVTISGLITHFETTNYVPEGTYFFYTVSGVKSFFQKNPDESFWRDFSIGLPDSEITIIRVDDFI